MPSTTTILGLSSRGVRVKAVQAKLGKIGIAIPAAETGKGLFGAETASAVGQFQGQVGLPVTGVMDGVTLAMLTSAASVMGTARSLVSGMLTMDYGLPASAITVRLYGVGFAGSAKKLAEGRSGANGVYSLAYSPEAAFPGIEVRTVNPQGGEVTLTSVIYNPPQSDVLKLVVPASVRPLTTEYQRLSAAMKTAIGGIQNLSKAQETDGQQDLMLLNQSTAWDARLLALAATAAQQTAATGLSQEILYALYRTGLPTDPQALASILPATVRTALATASQAGIVTLNSRQIASAQSAFTAFSTKTNLGLKVSGATSSFSDLLGGVIANSGLQSAFATVFFDPTVSDADLWTKAAAAGISADQIATLQFQGKLAFLTYNNAALVQGIQKTLGSATDPAALADADFHLDVTWVNAINAIAGNDPAQLQLLIPATYGGDQLEAYAADLARKVRVSFPTRVVARMAETGALKMDANLAPQVGAFLRAADSAGYQLGRTPLNAFLRNLPASVPQLDSPTTEAVKTLHRLFQVTPSNESLQAALNSNFTSARDIAAYKPDEFIALFGSSFPSVEEAALVYQKAQQVASVTLNIYAIAKQLDIQPALFAMSASSAERQGAKAAVAQQFPALAGLFGSLDYCECLDCRSVLSPAAYFVDLIHTFLDRDTTVPPSGTPFAALIARRPDLPNLNLSCDNTNTALPYIDVVNEILEYFVANPSGLQNLAYDTGAANSADLIAEPQNIYPAAYGVLANRTAAAVYPLSLPFDLWTETVRGFLNYFKLPLWQILDAFRQADSLELLTDTTVPPPTYYRAAIFLEALGFSPPEYALLTNTAVISSWFSLYGYADQATALSELTSAATLADTLGIMYQDLSDIMQTGFLNPSLVPLTITLEKFGLSLRDVFTYTGQPGFVYSTPPTAASQKAAFEANLQKLMSQDYPGADPTALQSWLASVLTPAYSNGVLVLQAPSEDTCDFQNTLFQCAGGSAATSLDFLKLNFFVRIWQKLGWSIDEVDRALQVFLAPLLPAATDPTLGADLSNAMMSSLIYLSHFQTLFGMVQPGPFGRVGFLPVWSATIPTTGENPLYAQLFLTDAVLNNDPIFDSPVGQYLCYFDTVHGQYIPFTWQAGLTGDDVASGFVLLGNHLTAIQGALGLTANDVESILADNGKDVSSEPLTQESVSLLYRYAALSQGLQLSIGDFIALKLMSVDVINTVPLNPVNPFDPLIATPLAKLRDDRPWGETIQFANQAGAVQASGFSVPDLQYILCHQVVDPAGPYAPDPAGLMQQVRSLAAVIQAIKSQNAVPSDATTFTDDLIRQRMSQIYPANVAQAFMGMWTGSIHYTATPVAIAGPIPSAVFSDDPSVQLVFDQTTGTETLILQGVPTTAVMAGLSAELGTLVTGGTITAAQQTLLQGLLDDVHGQALTFFQTYLQESTVGSEQAGFLQAGDFDGLFGSPSGSLAARTTLADEFLPYLQDQLVGQAIIQSLVAELGADASLTKTLLTNTAVLSDPTQAPVPPTALLEAFKASADIGVSVTYFSGSSEDSGTGTGPVLVATANTDLATNPSKPTPVNSAHFEGYLEVPVDGPYRFTAILPNGTATAQLQFDFLTAPLALTAGAPTGSPATYPYSGYTEFKAGIPSHFTLDILGLAGGDASLLVQGESLPLGPLSQLTLYPEASVLRFGRAQILLAKAWQLIQGLKLDESEVTYLVTNSADFGNVSFNALPTQVSDYSVAGAQALFGQFLRLANYAQLKAGPAGGTDGLIGIFQNARQVIPAAPLPAGITALQVTTQNFYQAIANVTRRDIPTIQSVIGLLWPAAIQTAPLAGPPAQFQFTVLPLVNDLGFARLWAALQMVQTLGIQPQVLQQTTGIVSSSRAAANPDPGVGIAQSLRNAVKSQYTPDQWRPVAQFVFDPLRQMKRDALCAHILTLPPIVQFGATDTNGLFEYFLVDPGMEPVVQTSRIRLALSSVQTFIQRCLLNLEPKVQPSAIDSDVWEWMKRYRVWEANREIFLWPENWLIPEFRENATDLFQALQGALLQGDITQDLVEQAFTQYLQDLDARARLDIVSLFNEQPAQGDPPASNTLHVIGRNYGKPAKYFYRTFTNGIWEGWIPVTPDIDGDHIVAVVWRGRLNLFWLTFVVQGAPPAAAASTKKNSDGTSGATVLTKLTMDDLSNSLQGVGKPDKTAQVQLNWSEYYQAQWTARKTSDITRFTPIKVDDDFDAAADVYVHASIETDGEGNETAVRIHMDGLKQAFRLSGKNSEPVCASSYAQASRWDTPGSFAIYQTNEGVDATKFIGQPSDPNSATEAWVRTFMAYNLIQEFTAVGDVVKKTSGGAPVPILNGANSYNLLLCDNLTPTTGYPSGAGGLYRFYTSQIAAMSLPFFFEDTPDPNTSEEITFFVQPTVVETTLSRYKGWAVRLPFQNLTLNSSGYWNGLVLKSQVPSFAAPSPPDTASVFAYQPNADSIVNDTTLIPFGTSVIGATGGNLAIDTIDAGLSIASTPAPSGATAAGGLKGAPAPELGSAPASKTQDRRTT